MKRERISTITVIMGIFGGLVRWAQYQFSRLSCSFREGRMDLMAYYGKTRKMQDRYPEGSVINQGILRDASSNTKATRRRITE